MPYADHFQHADDVVAHLNTFVPGLGDPLLRVKYTGFVTVAAVTVYELAIKEIFCEFGRRKHKVLGKFTERYFERINGRVAVKSIREDYCARFGDVYVDRFKKKLDARAKAYLTMHKRDVRSAYGNMIVWRNDFAHEGQIPNLPTYGEAVQSYEDGKEVIHALAAAMVR